MVRYIILAHKCTVGVEIVLTAVNEQLGLDLALALGLDGLESLCKLLGHILAGTWYDTEIGTIIIFSVST